MGATGLPFSRMSVAQQQRFLANVVSGHPLEPPVRSLEELARGTLRVEYTVPGWFQWGNPDLRWHWANYLVVTEPGPHGRWAPRPPIRERTREAVMQAVRRVDPQIRSKVIHVMRDKRGHQDPEPDTPWEAQIFPTTLNLTFIYIPGATNERMVHIVHLNGDSWHLLW
jgi:hypothetical protein